MGGLQLLFLPCMMTHYSWPILSSEVLLLMVLDALSASTRLCQNSLVRSKTRAAEMAHLVKVTATQPEFSP